MSDHKIKESSLGVVPVGQFDSTAIMLASKLTREIRKRSGCVVKLNDANLVNVIGRKVQELDEHDLNLINRLFVEHVSQISASSPAKAKQERYFKPQAKTIKSRFLHSLTN